MKESLLFLLLLPLYGVVEVESVEPVARPLPRDLVGNRNTDHVIELKGNIEIPDADELNWPIQVNDDFEVAAVKVGLRGLNHQYAADLEGSLIHGTRSSVFLRNEGGKLQFGTQRKPLNRLHEAYSYTPGQEHVADGMDYTFSDVVTNNLALGRPATQSSTGYGADASRAVDGDTNGFFSGDSVTHTDAVASLNSAEPWWEVDLGTVQEVRTIRLWNREQEVNVDEVQEIRVRASTKILGGSFRLSYTFSGVEYETGDISVFAVATRLEEDYSSSSPPPGSGPGQSMQAAIEALPVIHSVRVTKLPSTDKMEGTWRVTFRSEQGNLTDMVLVENNIVAVLPNVEIETLRQGNENKWYNYQIKVDEIPGRLFPCWLLLSSSSSGDAALDTAKANAQWKIRLAESRRETIVTIPGGASGRYLRVQLEDHDYLSIAELQVFSEMLPTVANYKGGSPIIAGDYQSQEALDSKFALAPARGVWLLKLRDVKAAEIINTGTSLPLELIHGLGGLSTWWLELTDTFGNVHQYHADVAFRIEMLPIFGTLHYYNAVTFMIGEEIAPDPDRLSFQLPCRDDCAHNFGVGNPGHGGRVPEGSIAVYSNRVTAVDNDMKVVYRPISGFVGDDVFTYTMFVGTSESDTAELRVATRKCRLDCVNEVFNDLVW